MAENSRYKLIKKLARGGMAEIYLGRKEAEDGFTQLVCIKRILPHYSQEKEYIEMFRDEAHICKRLQHGNIVRVESFEEVEDSFAIIMEYVNGPDLRKLLVACENTKQPIPMSMLIYITAEIAKGLHHAHTKIDEITQKPLKIVHRDVSPQNILISFDGEVKVTDFGIADAKNKSTETKPGIVKGKYSYMSPEQIMAKQVDARTDVFALAIILWEMVAMERLFHADNDVITIQKVKNGEIKPLPTNKRKDGEIDSELTKIIYKGLQKDVRKRYKSANEFEQALRSYLNKKYPKFSQSGFSEFLKTILKNQVDESQEVIKEALTSLKEKPKKKFTLTGNEAAKSEEGKLPDLKQQFNLAAPSGLKVSGGQSTQMPVSQYSKLNASSKLNQKPGLHSKMNPSMVSKKTMPKSGQLSGHQARFKSAQKGSGLLISPVTIVGGIVGLILVVVLSKFFIFDRIAHTAVSFKVSPSNVKISVDGKRMNNGRFIKTPFTFNLKPGKHVVTISREGYQTSSWKFAVNSSEKMKKLDLALKRTAQMSPVVVRTVPSGAKAWVSINNGVYTGKIPSNIGNLIFGKAHSMRILPKYPKKTGAFTCTFVPTSKSLRSPYYVNVDIKRRRCTFSLSR